MNAIFPGIEKTCDVFLARENVDTVKPDPAHLLRAIKRLGLSKNGCLLVSDNLPDIQAVSKVKMRCAAVTSGNFSEEELKKGKPDFLSSNVLELANRLIYILIK